MTELNDPLTTPEDFQNFKQRNYAWRKWIYETQMWVNKFQELQKDIAAGFQEWSVPSNPGALPR